MFTLVGNTTGSLTRLTGTTRRGEPEWDATPVRCAVDVIQLSGKIAKTSVRTDSSASRGNAEEREADARILFQLVAKPKTGDRFEIDGLRLRIESVELRRDTFGQPDHYDTSLVLWDDSEELLA